jgi:hypothetical protein
MDQEHTDAALQAANLALTGRRLQRAASRFASIQLRGIDADPASDRHHLGWEIAAVSMVSLAAVLGVAALWFI